MENSKAKRPASRFYGLSRKARPRSKQVHLISQIRSHPLFHLICSENVYNYLNPPLPNNCTGASKEATMEAQETALYSMLDIFDSIERIKASQENL